MNKNLFFSTLLKLEKKYIISNPTSPKIAPEAPTDKSYVKIKHDSKHPYIAAVIYTIATLKIPNDSS